MDGAGASEVQRRSNKRTFGEMTARYRTHSESPSMDDHYNNERPSQRPRLGLSMSRARFPGDGLDYRRPITSTSVPTTNGNNVIDLTEEAENSGGGQHAQIAAAPTGTTATSRNHNLPRFGRDIIDVEELDGPDSASITSQDPHIQQHGEHQSVLLDIGNPTRTARPHPQYSQLRRPPRRHTPAAQTNDVEIISSRPVSRTQMQRLESAEPRPTDWTDLRSVTPFPGSGSIDLTTFDLTRDDDDVIEVESRPRQGINLQGPAATGGLGTRAAAEHSHSGTSEMTGLGQLVGMMRGDGRLRQRVMQMTGGQHARPPRWTEAAGWIPPLAVPPSHDNRGPYFPPILPPPIMDYSDVAFELIPGANRPATPPYQAPPLPPTGFTRSPEEDETVVCPRCGDELATDFDEVKQQVWVVKGCGHAYCGTCALTRKTPSSRKGKGKAHDGSAISPLKKCLADGCGKSLTSKAMIQVYMS